MPYPQRVAKTTIGAFIATLICREGSMPREEALRCGARIRDEQCKRRATVAFIIGGRANPPLLRCASDAEELREGLRRFLREGTWIEERIPPRTEGDA